MGITYTKQPVKAVSSDVTASRLLGTEYQNTTGRPILAIVNVYADKKAADDSAYAIGLIGPASASVTVIRVGFIGLSGTAVQKCAFCVVFLIPNEYYYKVDTVKSGTSTVLLDIWIEVEL